MKRLLAVLVTLGVGAPAAAAAPRIDLDSDRARADDAAVIVSADRRYLAEQVYREYMLNASWQHEIALGHTKEAGMLAVEHWKAVQAEHYARYVLSRASNDFVGAKVQLVVDEFALQHA